MRRESRAPGTTTWLVRWPEKYREARQNTQRRHITAGCGHGHGESCRAISGRIGGDGDEPKEGCEEAGTGKQARAAEGRKPSSQHPAASSQQVAANGGGIKKVVVASEAHRMGSRSGSRLKSGTSEALGRCRVVALSERASGRARERERETGGKAAWTVPQRCVVLSGEGRYFAIARRRLAPFFVENQVTQLRARSSTQRLHHDHHSQHRQHSRHVQSSCFCTLVLVLVFDGAGWSERRASVRPTKQDRPATRPGRVRSGLRRLSR
jgi:hypothetical protein